MTAHKTPDQAAHPVGNDGAADDAVATPGSEGQTTPEVETLRAEVEEYRDRYLRAKAESENVRRRAELDVANARKFAIDSFAAEVLTVRDNLERAQAIPLSSPEVVAKVIEGLALTLSELESVLERQGLAAVDPRGERFDPERHQAMTSVATNEVPPGHVVEVMQKGYLLNGRLVRPAMVVVARAPGA